MQDKNVQEAGDSDHPAPSHKKDLRNSVIYLRDSICSCFCPCSCVASEKQV